MLSQVITVLIYELVPRARSGTQEQLSQICHLSHAPFVP